MTQDDPRFRRVSLAQFLREGPAHLVSHTRNASDIPRPSRAEKVRKAKLLEARRLDAIKTYRDLWVKIEKSCMPTLRYPIVTLTDSSVPLAQESPFEQLDRKEFDAQMEKVLKTAREQKLITPNVPRGKWHEGKALADLFVLLIGAHRDLCDVRNEIKAQSKPPRGAANRGYR